MFAIFRPHLYLRPRAYPSRKRITKNGSTCRSIPPTMRDKRMCALALGAFRLASWRSLPSSCGYLEQLAADRKLRGHDCVDPDSRSALEYERGLQQ
jgi:hypothetical protein